MTLQAFPRLRIHPPAMQKVDQLNWKVGFALKCYGVRIGVRANERAMLEQTRRHLPAGWESISSPIVDRVYSILTKNGGNREKVNLLYGDDVRLARSANNYDILETFESDLRLFVAELAKHRVFVHAGVVGWKGQAIIVPGRSFSGKSTLVAELVKAGATYYSDEYAVLDSRGRVHPFAKPLELREEGEYAQKKVTAAELGGELGAGPLPVGLVLMTRFKRGASWRPRKLSPGQGVLEMLFNTVSARRSPERAMATLQRVTARAEVLKGVRGNAVDVASAVLRRVENNGHVKRR
jgi:hypothetical protein